MKNIAVEIASGRGVADRWRGQYRKQDGQWSRTIDGSSEDTYDKLAALGVDPAPAEVAKIVSPGWAYPSCNGCGEYRERVIAVNCYDDYTANLCAECLERSIALLKAV